MVSILLSGRKINFTRYWSTLKTMDRGSFVIFVFVSCFLLTFMVYPVALVVVDAFKVQGTFSLQHFEIFWSNRFYRSGLINSLLLASLSVIATSIIGVPLAYIMVKYDFPGKRLFSALSIIPMIKAQ